MTRRQVANATNRDLFASVNNNPKCIIRFFAHGLTVCLCAYPWKSRPAFCQICCMRNSDGTPKGCAFVKFSTRSAANSAIESLDGKYTMVVSQHHTAPHRPLTYRMDLFYRTDLSYGCGLPYGSVLTNGSIQPYERVLPYGSILSAGSSRLYAPILPYG